MRQQRAHGVSFLSYFAALWTILLVASTVPRVVASPTPSRRPVGERGHSAPFIPLSRRASSGARKTQTYNTLLRPVEYNEELTAEVYINGEPHWLLVDTGSADLWVLSPNFQCLTAQLAPTAQSNCITGSPFFGSLDLIKDKSFNITYGNNEALSGAFGYAEVSIGGLVVKKQQVALVDRAFLYPDRVISGFIGLASHLVTFQYSSPDGSNANLNQTEHYTPVIESLYSTHKINATFSLAIKRGPDAGYLAFGGLPPVNVSGAFATTKFAGIPFKGTAPKKRYYPIQPQSFELNGRTFNTSYRAIVDSGTYAFRFPPAMADQINAAFNPPATYNSTYGYYLTSCNSTAPKFGVGIGGQTFVVHPQDLSPLVRQGNICATNVLRGFAFGSVYPDGFYVLGSAFLHNVVAVFDDVNGEMHFAPHEY